MHEFGVAQAALETALERAEQAYAAQITDVYLTIGIISSIEPDSIRLYWEEIAEGSLAQDARLHFRRVPTESFCADCGCSFETEEDLHACPKCGSEQVRAVDDEFLALEAIDIEPLSVEASNE